MYIISACLLGENCKYNGGNNYNDAVQKFADTHDCILVCPEIDGGLAVPRLPIEKKGNRFVSSAGIDMTDKMFNGAMESLFEALNAASNEQQSIQGAILKSKSPSCGVGVIYDGTFSHKEVKGDGAFAEILKKANIPVYTEDEIDKVR